MDNVNNLFIRSIFLQVVNIFMDFFRYYGGWAAPNIYFLGFAGVVKFGKLRIGGLSGIYNARHYHLGWLIFYFFYFYMSYSSTGCIFLQLTPRSNVSFECVCCSVWCWHYGLNVRTNYLCSKFCIRRRVNKNRSMFL